jgi:hypothetical protein
VFEQRTILLTASQEAIGIFLEKMASVHHLVADSLKAFVISGKIGISFLH